MSSDRVIEIEGLGPIKEPFRLPAPTQGGLVELTGHNGAGKSTVLEVVKGIAGAHPGVTVNRDWEAGRAFGLGVTLTFGRRFLREGELVVKAMSSDVDPSVFINPKYKDPDTRDDHRGRMLCAIYGIGPNLDLFRGLFGKEDPDKIIGMATRGATTLPEQARELKLDFERAARAIEHERAGLMAKAQNASGAAAGVDLNAECNPEVLSKALENAVRALALAEGESIAAKKRGDAWASAKAKLDAAQQGFSPFAAKTAQTRIDEAREQVKAAESEVATAFAAHTEASAKMTVATDLATRFEASAADTTAKANAEADKVMAEAEAEAKRVAGMIMDQATAKARAVRDDAARVVADARSKVDNDVRDAHSALNEAKAILESRNTQMQTAARQVLAGEKELEQAIEAEKAVAEVRALVDAGAGDPGPTPARLAELRDAITAAENAVALGVRVRDARKHRADAEDATRQAQQAENRMFAMRDGAAGCWDVVASAISRVAPQGIRFNNGRLVVDRNGETVMLDELSDGEVIEITIKAIAAALGPGGMFTIDQGWWGELQPQKKAEIRELLIKNKILGITARATDGELAATVL